MGRYPTFEDQGDVLDPRNPVYERLLEKVKDLKDAEDDWYRLRRDVFDEYDFGNFGDSISEVEERYDRIVGDEPWNYTRDFNRIDPDKKSSTGQFRPVSNTFELSEISDGYRTDVFVKDRYDDENFVRPEDRRGIFGDPEPAPRVLAYEVGRGKGRIDLLYPNLIAFKDKDIDKGDESDTTYYVYDEDDEMYVKLKVFAGFSDRPYRYDEEDGFSEQVLSSMHAAGLSWDDKVRPALNAYRDALDDYRDNGGGDLDFDFLGGTLDRPWDGYEGKKVSYNKPEPLPNQLVRQARGVPNIGEQ